MLNFKILGNLAVVVGDRSCTPTTPKPLQVLALLLAEANQVVHVDSIIEEIWDDNPPKSAMTTLQTYIYQLRKHLAAMGVERPDGLLVTRPPGYLLRLGPDCLDADVFQQLARKGQSLLDTGHPAEASVALRGALALWTGDALADVIKGGTLIAHAAYLDEQRLRTLELRIMADVQLGRHRELVGELRTLVVKYPYNEWLHGQLISALSACGRRNEALDSFQRLRMILDEELGIEPSFELRQLQQKVLASTA